MLTSPRSKEGLFTSQEQTVASSNVSELQFQRKTAAKKIPPIQIASTKVHSKQYQNLLDALEEEHIG